MKRKLESVTLLGIDCVDIDRLIQAVNICKKDFDFAEIKILSSLESNSADTAKIEEIKTVEDYSKFIIEKLDNYFNTSHVLVIQYDGFILNPNAWNDEYLNYDYIGAPWKIKKSYIERHKGWEELLGKEIVGNGGFSLRSKKLTSLCAKLTKENFFEKYHPEDWVLCIEKRNDLENAGIKFSPIELAKQFSYEARNDEDYIWDQQFGFHGLKWTDISKWLEQNPGYKIDNSLNRHK